MWAGTQRNPQGRYLFCLRRRLHVGDATPDGRCSSPNLGGVMARLRKTLVPELNDLLNAAGESGDYAEVHAAMERCEIGAHEAGASKSTA